MKTCQKKGWGLLWQLRFPALNSYPVIPTVIPCYMVLMGTNALLGILTWLLTCKRNNPQIEGEKSQISSPMKVTIQKICF
jgi:hypothetical protein